MSRLAVVVLNWNAAATTLACVSRIAQWQTIDTKIIVVDNASLPDDVAQLAQGAPVAVLLQNDQNFGFAGGCNRGVAHVRMHWPQLPVLLLNNDVNLDEEVAGALCDSLARDQTLGIVGPLMRSEAQSDEILSSGGRSMAWHLDTHRHDVPPAGLRECEFISGAAALIRPEVFARCGLFDERFFFISEMADLCVRARKAGLRTVIQGAVSATHDTVQRAHSILHAYYMTRNRLLFLRKHGYGYLLGPWAAISLAIATKAGASGRRAQSRAMALGVRDALAGRFGDQNERVRKHCA